MRRKSLVVVFAALVAAVTPARAEFPFLADPDRCDTSGNPLGCIPLPNETSGAAGSCNDSKWKYASTDNDPFDEVQYGHGTGETRDSAAEANVVLVGGGPGNDRLVIRGTVSLVGGSDGIDPQSQGLGVSLDALRFDLPPGVLTGQSQRWRHRDSTGQASSPDGITSLTLRRVASSAAYRLTVRGRDAELSAFGGTTDRAITLDVGVGNDCASTTVNFRRVGTNLRSVQ